MPRSCDRRTRDRRNGSFISTAPISAKAGHQVPIEHRSDSRAPARYAGQRYPRERAAAIRATIYATRAASERSLMARGVFAAAAAESRE
jgi:hypothetical protein